MEATASQLPESYDFSQSQFTQTQPQTQPDTQPTCSSTAFPSHLWGILLSSSGESSSTSASLSNGNGNGNGNGLGGSTGDLDRPTRFEFIRGTSGGKGMYTIGRHPKSDVRLNSPKVSNNHARISISSQDGLVRLEDLSTNGTFVRGVKVRSSSSRIVLLGTINTGGCVRRTFGIQREWSRIVEISACSTSHTSPDSPWSKRRNGVVNLYYAPYVSRILS